ncbi:MAG: GNAT family N-acetyltransferase [Phycisphaerales bacterium]|nr:GNAT family N-acetyltransferase [Phycisphaerales bacterium]
MSSTNGAGEQIAVTLRPTIEADLTVFFENQRDPEAIRVAAFTPEDPEDHGGFVAHWGRLLADEGKVKRSILVDGACVGHIVSFERFGNPEITYWIARDWWGRGVTTRALGLFLEGFDIRPLQARAASDNLGSIRVLERNGFRVIGYDRFYAAGRGEEIAETILELS